VSVHLCTFLPKSQLGPRNLTDGTPAQVSIDFRTPEINKQDLKVSLYEQISALVFPNMVSKGKQLDSSADESVSFL